MAIDQGVRPCSRRGGGVEQTAGATCREQNLTTHQADARPLLCRTHATGSSSAARRDRDCIRKRMIAAHVGRARTAAGEAGSAPSGGGGRTPERGEERGELGHGCGERQVLHMKVDAAAGRCDALPRARKGFGIWSGSRLGKLLGVSEKARALDKARPSPSPVLAHRNRIGISCHRIAFGVNPNAPCLILGSALYFESSWGEEVSLLDWTHTYFADSISPCLHLCR